jgi:hypothetical protein
MLGTNLSRLESIASLEIMPVRVSSIAVPNSYAIQHRLDYPGEKMTETKKSNTMPSVLSYDDVKAVLPALEHHTKGPLLDGLWKRPKMSPRDRSIVTVAALNNVHQLQPNERIGTGRAPALEDQNILLGMAEEI